MAGIGMRLLDPVSAAWNTVARFDDYESAQRAVDQLSDDGFPVEKLDIVGSGLRLVERVTGRLTRGRAAAAGALSGLWVGLLFGVGQQRTTSLKIDDNGLQYEAGTFVLRTTWADLDRIGQATLPSGPTTAIVLAKGGLRWAQTPQTRAQITQRGWDRIIPIDDFAPRWPDGKLGDAIRAHRPDLLEG